METLTTPIQNTAPNPTAQAEAGFNSAPEPLPPLTLDEFDYPLSHDSIAQQPLEQRDASRLLVLNRATGEIVGHDRFFNLPEYFEPGDLLVMNETKVSASRLFGTLPSGGRAEFLLTHRVQEGLWQCLAKPGKRLRPGARVDVGSGLTVEIADVLDERGSRLARLEINGGPVGTDEAVERAGLTPLPPYIHADNPNQYKERYQTVYATAPGSAAAPTAGLHFTPELLEQVRERGVEIAKVTLHVGIGTFRPIEVRDIRDHVMHEEQGVIPDETSRKISEAKGRIIAVGTTSVRALESAAIGPREVRPGPFRTQLYVTPGYRFQIADALVTNFHMPRSTLLVLVSAFAGRENMLAAYAAAGREGYRFLSFGDSMLIMNAPQRGTAPD